MEKENISALIGWGIACLIAIVLFIMGWNYLFSEPVNTDGGMITETENQEAGVPENANPVWEKHSDHELTIYRSIYSSAPASAKEIATAKKELNSLAKKDLVVFRHDDKVKNCIDRLLMLNKFCCNRTAKTGMVSEVRTKYPTLKKCSSCSGKIVIPCKICKEKDSSLSFGRARSMLSDKKPAPCKLCKNTKKIICPDCRKNIMKMMADEAQKITPYCKQKLDEVETEQRRRRSKQ